MTRGTFDDSHNHSHLQRRMKLLMATSLPSIQADIIHSDGFTTDLKPIIAEHILSHNIAIIKLGILPTNEEYIEIGSWLGILQAERAEQIKNFTQDKFILNIVSKVIYDGNPDFQPFSKHFLTLHTEGSRLPLDLQPRYISLLCHSPGDTSNQSLTLLTPVSEVLKQLTSSQLDVLSHLRYANSPIESTFLARTKEQVFLSFRDFYPEQLPWTCDENRYSEEEINLCISSLLTAMYNPDIARSISWEKGMLVIFDNRCFFHGKTQNRGTPNKNKAYRHLKRLRILKHS